MVSKVVNDRQKVNEQGSLKTMSRINEGLKRIVSLSREVEIRAINARLLARQAGTASEEYRVAAAELGNYSRELGKLAGVMESAIFEAVHLAAGMQKLKKLAQLLAATANVSTSERVRRCAADAGQRLEQVALQSEINCRRLGSTLRRVWQLGDKGYVVARLARLEAVRAGAMSGVMMEAVAAIEETTARIVEIMRDLTHVFQKTPI